MQSLSGIPFHVAHAGIFASQFAPRFLLAEVPNDHGAIGGGGGEDVWDLGIPCRLGDVGVALGGFGGGGVNVGRGGILEVQD